MEQPLDRLMEAELPEFLADASNAVPGEFIHDVVKIDSVFLPVFIGLGFFVALQ